MHTLTYLMLQQNHCCISFQIVALWNKSLLICVVHGRNCIAKLLTCFSTLLKIYMLFVINTKNKAERKDSFINILNLKIYLHDYYSNIQNIGFRLNCNECIYIVRVQDKIADCLSRSWIHSLSFDEVQPL